MKKQIKNILLKVLFIVLAVSMPIITFVLLAYDLPLYIKVTLYIYYIVVLIFIDKIYDILFPETEHTREESKTDVNIEESKNQTKERTE